MTVVHFSTELSGGAGSLVRCIHVTMQDMGISSLVITRELNDLDGTITIKPITRISASMRARWNTVLGKLGYIKDSYAMFGIVDRQSLGSLSGEPGVRIGVSSHRLFSVKSSQ